jgi:hypothetical protein
MLRSLRLVRTVRTAALTAFVTCLFTVSPAAEPAWEKAHLQPPMTAAETRQFMRELAQFVFDNHLKKKADSPQRGMVYEYLDVRRKGQFDQFVQGEALDTMHDGAWLAAALATAYRATGDPFYREFLTRWLLPFYLKMLNHSDELFATGRNDGRPGAHVFDREHLLQAGEKGFVPYFWDDGGSVSLERRIDRNVRGPFPCVDNLAGKPNPRYLLDGYSLGSSNHMAQDLGVMLMVSWLLLKDSADAADQTLAREVAEAAKNLHECRMRHHGPIPMCVAPAALALGDAKLMKHVPSPDDPHYWQPDNHYVRAMVKFKSGERCSLPGFADDQEYRYYFGIARSGGRMPEPLAFKTIYDAYTQPLLYRAYSDDAPVPPGINVFDLHPYYFLNGKPLDYRSQRKGPGGGPRPIGSRMGPQNMACCGWALQMLKAYPGIWEKRHQHDFPKDARLNPAGAEDQLRRSIQRELAGGLRTWQAIFREKGYIPTGIGAGAQWDHFSDTGGYAHLIAAAAQWMMYLEGKRDWELHHVPQVRD